MQPVSGTLHALGIIQLLIVNLGIIPARRCLVNIEMSLDLPIDIDHRAIRAMVRDEDFNPRRPILLYRSAGNAVPRKESRQSALRNVWDKYVCMYVRYTYAQPGPLGSQYGVPDEMML